MYQIADFGKKNSEDLSQKKDSGCCFCSLDFPSLVRNDKQIACYTTAHLYLSIDYFVPNSKIFAWKIAAVTEHTHIF